MLNIVFVTDEICSIPLLQYGSTFSTFGKTEIKMGETVEVTCNDGYALYKLGQNETLKCMNFGRFSKIENETFDCCK